MALSHDHDVAGCHKANNDRQKIIENLKDLVNCLDDCDRTGNEYGGRAEPPAWTRPLIVYPLTKERPPAVTYTEKIPPWEKRRKSVQVMGGAIVKGCSCLRRDGLQADCQMSGCKGHPLCLTKPYPLCPPSGRADMPVTPDQAEQILRQLGPAPAELGPGQCAPGQGCHPECVPCSSTIRNVCQWMPEWMNEEKAVCDKGTRDKATSGAGVDVGFSSMGPNASKGAEDATGKWWCCVVSGV